jgi:hypothetical protein
MTDGIIRRQELRTDLNRTQCQKPLTVGALATLQASKPFEKLEKAEQAGWLALLRKHLSETLPYTWLALFVLLARSWFGTQNREARFIRRCHFHTLVFSFARLQIWRRRFKGKEACCPNWVEVEM